MGREGNGLVVRMMRATTGRLLPVASVVSLRRGNLRGSLFLSSTLMATLSALYCYPVKGCRGIALPEAVLDAHGIDHDREFLVVDAQDRFLTQRAMPALALIETALTQTALVLRRPGGSELRFPGTGLRPAPTGAPSGDGLEGHDCWRKTRVRGGGMARRDLGKPAGWCGWALPPSVKCRRDASHRASPPAGARSAGSPSRTRIPC